MAISVKVIKGLGDVEASPIQDELISTDWIAVLRGSTELWKVYYDRVDRTVLVPYGGSMDGDVVGMVVPDLPVGRHLVLGVVITIEDESGKITEKIELEGEHAGPGPVAAESGAS